MRNISNYIYSMIGTILIVLISTSTTIAQSAPYINSISTPAAAPGETITISGINFNTIAANNIVFFGGAQASVTAATEILLTVVVPNHATTDVVNVTDNSTGLTGYSNEIFNIEFSGVQPLLSDIESDITSQSVFAASGKQTQDLCLCDFDLDGMIDIIITNAGADATKLDVFRNTSSIGTTNLVSQAAINTTFEAINISCGDLDGDGKPDLVVSQESSKSVLVYRNTSTGSSISFDSKITITLPDDKQPAHVVIKDLDLDGKPEIITTTKNDNSIDVFINNSTVGNISFPIASAITLDATDENAGAGLNGLDVKDLNNDGLPDIAASNDNASSFYIFQNSSEPNAISFLEYKKVSTGGSLRKLKIADINNDGFADVILSNGLSSQDVFEIVPNNTASVGDEIMFGTSVTMNNVKSGWGVDVADIDGDGDLDLAFASLTKAFYVSINNTPGTISTNSFISTPISTAEITRNIKLADIDGDGKPDFIYTHKSLTSTSGELAIQLNKICMTPRISPSGDVKICSGGSIELKANAITGLTYQWRKDDAGIPGANSQTYTATSAGSYTVVVNDVDANGNNCNIQSEAAVVTIDAALFTPPTFETLAASCQGTDIDFTVTDSGSNTYAWTGPNGFTSTEKALTITDLKSSNAGEYSVVFTSADGCISNPQSQTLEVITVPVVTVNNANTDEFCNDGSSTITLTLTDFGSIDYSYKWQDTSGDISGATGTSFTIPATTTAETKSYRGVITTTGNTQCSYTTDFRNVISIATPISDYSSELSKCIDLEIPFSATSTGASGFEVLYTWDFGDGSQIVTTTELDTAHTFITANIYAVKLTAAYTEVDNCITTPKSSNISISAPLTGTDLDLIRSDNTIDTNFEKCPSGDLSLNVTGTYDKYQWQSRLSNDVAYENLGLAPSQNISDTVFVQVDLTDPNGCNFIATSVSVKNLQNSGFSIETASSGNTIITNDPEIGKKVELNEGQSSINLFINSIVTNITWSPTNVFLSEADISSNDVTAYPHVVRQFVQVQGTDGQGCVESDSITLVNNFTLADKNFSPNGDGIGDCWEISNSQSINTSDQFTDFSGCKITIFDSKGRNVMQKLGPFPDDCVWNGNQNNGSELPEGVYYFVLKCNDAAYDRSGSILLAR